MQTFTLLRDGEFELAILNVVTSNISWSVNRVDWLRFRESFCEGNYDDSRGRISVASVRR